MFESYCQVSTSLISSPAMFERGNGVFVTVTGRYMADCGSHQGDNVTPIRSCPKRRINLNNIPMTEFYYSSILN